MRTLPPGPAPRAPRPGLRGAQHPSRALMGDPAGAAGLQREYDAQAPDWDAWVQSQPDYLVPLLDGLDRGLRPLPRDARVLDVGAGTGVATEVLRDRWPATLALDLSSEMLRRATGWRVQADVVRMPLRAGSVHLVVGLNAVPAWGELRRVLAPGGQLLWVSSFGEETPIWTAPGEVAAANPGWDATTASAGSGDWTHLVAENARS